MKIFLGLGLSLLVTMPAFGMWRYRPHQVAYTVTVVTVPLPSPVGRQSARNAETKAAHAAKAEQKAAVATAAASAQALTKKESKA